MKIKTVKILIEKSFQTLNLKILKKKMTEYVKKIVQFLKNSQSAKWLLKTLKYPIKIKTDVGNSKSNQLEISTIQSKPESKIVKNQYFFKQITAPMYC